MTAAIINGSLAQDTVSGRFRRFPGIRELVTVDSHSDKIEINDSPVNVLAGVPQVTADIAQHLFAERSKRPFDSMDDVLKRVPELQDSPGLAYLTAGSAA